MNIIEKIMNGFKNTDKSVKEFDETLKENFIGQKMEGLFCNDGSYTILFGNGYSLQFESDPEGMVATINDPEQTKVANKEV